MLAIHGDFQEKVYEELLNIMPNPDVDLTPIHINKMVYLDQCLRETQRLFPTVPLIGRSANETVNLKGYDIPPNIPIFIGIRQIHRNNEYYGPTAHLYNPDRFKPYEHHPNKERQGMYLPFSLGQRNCIGEFFFLCIISVYFFLFYLLLFKRPHTNFFFFHFLSYFFTGYSYAIYTMKLVAAHILRNYRLSSPLKLHELKVKLSVSFRLVNKHLIQVHKRD